MNKYMKKNWVKVKINAMTIPELSLAMMVLVIFFGVLSFYAKYFEANIKLNNELDIEKKSWIVNQNKIFIAMQKWTEILSQPSISKENVLSLGCRFKPNKSKSIWDLPGGSDKDLPSNYKYCIFPTALGESSLDDLVDNKKNARPGIYFIYAIPDTISATTKPLRRVFCRPITFC